jgi:SAM-dependent methyltransferase
VNEPVDQDSAGRPSGSAPASAAPIRDGMKTIREDAARQLRRIGGAAAAVDPEDLPRFSARLADEIAPEQVAEIERRVSELEPWLQGPFLLPGGIVVGGVWRNDFRWKWLEQRVPELTGLRVLDVGSNAGYDPFMFKHKGAAEVLACEPFEFIEQARYLESIYETGVDFQRIGWQDLDPETHGRFDLVHCHGVLYHEPNPMMMLAKLRTMVADGGQLLFGSILHASSEQSEYLRFVPDSYAGDRTWWLVPGRLAMRWMLEVSGFETEELMIAEGVRGEFPTLTSYFHGRPIEPAPELGSPAYQEDRLAVRFPAGHYYSPMYDSREVASRRDTIWPAQPRSTPDIDWREPAQVELCKVFAAQEPLSLRRHQSEDPTEFWADNDQYPALDAWVLAAMLRHLRPRRMIEIGSGFSSLIAARLNRDELGESMRLTCIEPYPRDFLVAGVPGITELRVELVQDTPPEVFDELASGDVLFVDTSHTVKTGGDVTWIFHELLPRLAIGVHIHVHDMFLPGDYPEPWVNAGWGWNEVYLVRSFLSYNSAFEIVWGSQFMLQRHHDAVLRAFPGQAGYEHRGGAALWLRRAT